MGIMTTSNLDRIIEEVRTLTPEEQKSLRDLVDGLLATSTPQMTADEVELSMLEKGMITRIPPRIRDASVYANRNPVPVEGKPVSEIIIEERR
jgi:hypothetical protein